MSREWSAASGVSPRNADRRPTTACASRARTMTAEFIMIAGFGIRCTLVTPCVGASLDSRRPELRSLLHARCAPGASVRRSHGRDSAVRRHTVEGAELVIAARPWYMHRRTSRVERAASLPGGEMVEIANYRSDHAITIPAPADSVWPWLVQLGQDRAASTATTGSNSCSASTSTTPNASIRNGSRCRPAISFAPFSQATSMGDSASSARSSRTTLESPAKQLAGFVAHISRDRLLLQRAYVRRHRVIGGGSERRLAVVPSRRHRSGSPARPARERQPEPVRPPSERYHFDRARGRGAPSGSRRTGEHASAAHGRRQHHHQVGVSEATASPAAGVVAGEECAGPRAPIILKRLSRRER